MSCHNLSVNPHPKLGRERLAQVSDRTIITVLLLRESDVVPQHTLDLAGAPDLDTLRDEARLRGLNLQEVAS